MDDRDLCTLILQGRESRILDFKEATLWNPSDKRACCALVKDFLAFSNYRGGDIVIGVSERSGVPSFQGLSEDQLRSWDSTKVNQFARNYADPPINTTLSKVLCAGKHYIVIHVPAFEEQPHICVREYPSELAKQTLYFRTVNNESAPIGSAHELRALLDRAVEIQVQRRFEDFPASLGADPEAGERGKSACLTVSKGQSRGGTEFEFCVRNEGESAAHDVTIDYDVGDDFPAGPRAPSWISISPTTADDRTRRYCSKKNFAPPIVNGSGEHRPGQLRHIWVRLRYRDKVPGWHFAYFLFSLANSGNPRSFWDLSEETGHANVPRICRHVRPDAPVRETDDFTPAIPAVDPRDDLIIDSLGQRYIDDPHASQPRQQLVGANELGGHGERPIIKGLERLARKGFIRVEQRWDDGPSRVRLTEAGKERTLRRRYPDFDRRIVDVLRGVCAKFPGSTDETTVAEVAEDLDLPQGVVEVIAALLSAQKRLKRRRTADNTKLDQPDRQLCDELIGLTSV